MPDNEFDSNKPHSLADFITNSLSRAIFPKGLPAGIEPKEVAERLSKMTEIPLRPLCVPETGYFHGWFPKPVIRDDNNEQSFLIVALCGGGYELKFSQSAIDLLSV